MPDVIHGDPAKSNNENILNQGNRWRAGLHYSPAAEYCEIAVSSTAAGGRKVARIYDNGSGTWKAFSFYKKVALVPGKWYRISVKARITSGQGTKYARALLSYNDDDDAVNKYVTRSVTWTASELASGNWVTKYEIFQVPAGYVYNQIAPYLYGHFGGAGIVEYDDYRIEEFDSAPSGPPVDEVDPSVSKEKYKFTGKDLDEETGLMYFGARFYDAEVGRFVTQDPIKAGRNWYAYCNNNPLIYIDLTGMYDESFDDNDDDTYKSDIDIDELDKQDFYSKDSWFDSMVNSILVLSNNDQTVTAGEPPPAQSGYEAPKGGARQGRTKDGQKGWLDKNGNVWVPVPTGSRTAHGGGHWDVQYPRGGYDNVFPNGNVIPGEGPRGAFSPPGLRIDQNTIITGLGGLGVLGYCAYQIGKGIVAIATAPTTGGASLILLASP